MFSLLPEATFSSKPSSTQSPSPSPRVETAAATLNGKFYLFSGQGGVAMTPIDEQGSIWEYDPSSASWQLLSPRSREIHPAARSYHCTPSDGHDTTYVHSGCPEKGRLSDLWAFSVAHKEWTELAPAPGPPRGGTSIAFADGKLHRMNGFDGKTDCVPDGKEGLIPRSVSALLPMYVADRRWLVTLFGERDPSALGHQGAGKMLSDVWAFDVEKTTWTEVDT
ncbi:uncharacterized protein N7482_010402 [Penicillium canariense]|uniref:Kelch repeat protein n=1 Tax=Penicillium canariense TaxID=189055 RepID=A0A9W9HLZ3_9EURO|nr:uncharacterized protein N7482_010402 [Penicillium canariense]KAJ5151150.1 hypothetical protein N7482_010402 [Penicillium canariense]